MVDATDGRSQYRCGHHDRGQEQAVNLSLAESHVVDTNSVDFSTSSEVVAEGITAAIARTECKVRGRRLGIGEVRVGLGTRQHAVHIEGAHTSCRVPCASVVMPPAVVAVDAS